MLRELWWLRKLRLQCRWWRWRFRPKRRMYRYVAEPDGRNAARGREFAAGTASHSPQHVSTSRYQYSLCRVVCVGIVLSQKDFTDFTKCSVFSFKCAPAKIVKTERQVFDALLLAARSRAHRGVRPTKARVPAAPDTFCITPFSALPCFISPPCLVAIS